MAAPTDPRAAPAESTSAPTAPTPAVRPYDVAGPADAPAIVFVHGTMVNRAVWAPQLAALGDAFRIVAVDLPGHGVLRDERFTMARARERVVAAIEEGACGRAVLVGLSLGGYVAMDVAAARPDLVRALVLTGATAEPTGLRRLPFLVFAAVLTGSVGRLSAGIDAHLIRARFPAVIADPILAGGFCAAGGAVAVRAVARERFLPRLAAYPGPTLILNGAFDLPFRFYAPAFAAVAHDARRATVGGASHLANLERPVAYTRAIRRFVRSLPAEA